MSVSYSLRWDSKMFDASEFGKDQNEVNPEVRVLIQYTIGKGHYSHTPDILCKLPLSLATLWGFPFMLQNAYCLSIRIGLGK